jgi:hypothetical protein
MMSRVYIQDTRGDVVFVGPELEIGIHEALEYPHDRRELYVGEHNNLACASHDEENAHEISGTYPPSNAWTHDQAHC